MGLRLDLSKTFQRRFGLVDEVTKSQPQHPHVPRLRFFFRPSG
jgi:hypothetical protein